MKNPLKKKNLCDKAHNRLDLTTTAASISFYLQNGKVGDSTTQVGVTNQATHKGTQGSSRLNHVFLGSLTFVLHLNKNLRVMLTGVLGAIVNKPFKKVFIPLLQEIEKDVKILLLLLFDKMQNSPFIFHQNSFQSFNFQVYSIKTFPLTFVICCG